MGDFFLAFLRMGTGIICRRGGGGFGNMICRAKKYLRSGDLHTNSGLDPELHVFCVSDLFKIKKFNHKDVYDVHDGPTDGDAHLGLDTTVQYDVR